MDCGVAIKAGDEGTGKGNILVSTRQYSLGDTVLEENPLLTFSTIDEYIQNFKSSPPSIKSKIMEMCHRSEDKLSQPILRDSEQLGVKYDLPSSTIAALLDIRHTNGYSFKDTSESSRCGLFFIAGKANHSCHPNVAMCSKTKDTMQFIGFVRLSYCSFTDDSSHLPPSFICSPKANRCWRRNHAFLYHRSVLNTA